MYIIKNKNYFKIRKEFSEHATTDRSSWAKGSRPAGIQTEVVKPVQFDPVQSLSRPSSETQGQLVEAGKSLNGRGKKSGEFSFLTFLRPIFFLARLDFFPPPLTAPGSPRMSVDRLRKLRPNVNPDRGRRTNGCESRNFSFPA